MAHALLDCDFINEEPEQYLGSVGHVFAEFGALTQDSGNVSYGGMFGSTRFMAPEEFELGSLIDERTNVFVMGRTALVFLSDGALNADAFRGTRALFDVAAIACEPERSRRYDSMASFYHAWLAARNA